MKFNTYSRIVLPLSAVALAAMTLTSYADEAPKVLDPVSGQIMPLLEIDMRSLSDVQRMVIREQLSEMGMDRNASREHAMPEGMGMSGEIGEPGGNGGMGGSISGGMGGGIGGSIGGGMGGGIGGGMGGGMGGGIGGGMGGGNG